MADGNPSGGDGGQDVCSFFASFINQRQSVERLINWLRESQTVCTDTNCFDEINGMPGSEIGSGNREWTAEDGDGPLDSDPLALVLVLVLGILTFYAMNLSRNRENPAAQGEPLKLSNSRRRPTDGDDDHSRGFGGNDDDHSRPAI